MTQGDRLDRYFAVIAEHGYSPSNLRFYADYLFRGINLTGVMLDVGAGGGMFSFYSACAGVAWVVSLEPQVAGSASGMNEDFARIASLLGQDQVELVPKRLQDYEAGPESFHLLRLHASINHLDEDACTRLHTTRKPRTHMWNCFVSLPPRRGPMRKLIVADCARRNLWNDAGSRTRSCR